MIDRASACAATGGAMRATGFVSAVLLVVLLATSGWPSESQVCVVRAQVTDCEAKQIDATRAQEHKDLLLRQPVADVVVVLPRVLPWQRRMDSWGLPLPRAPTR